MVSVCLHLVLHLAGNGGNGIALGSGRKHFFGSYRSQLGLGSNFYRTCQNCTKSSKKKYMLHLGKKVRDKNYSRGRGEEGLKEGLCTPPISSQSIRSPLHNFSNL
eukprot:278442-Amorphochlora_amoeboformis.AAC.1